MAGRFLPAPRQATRRNDKSETRSPLGRSSGGALSRAEGLCSGAASHLLRGHRLSDEFLLPTGTGTMPLEWTRGARLSRDQRKADKPHVAVFIERPEPSRCGVEASLKGTALKMRLHFSTTVLHRCAA